MSPRWLILLFCLMLLAPAPVYPQVAIVIQVVKTALCAVSSTVFILARCAPRETLLCRIIAFKLKLICRTYPCTNYGAPSQRNCAIPPFGCLPWNIRPLGLCQPLRICCARGGSLTENLELAVNESQDQFALPNLPERDLSRWFTGRRHNGTRRAGPSSAQDPPPTIQPNNVAGNDLQYNKSPPQTNQTDFYIPTSAQEYMADWVYNEDDPAIVEQTIKYQYDKFMRELEAINKQEAEYGREIVRVPSFEEFRSIALGEVPVA